MDYRPELWQCFLVKIIIIWHYNPLWVFAFPAKSLQVLLSLATYFQFLTFSLFRSSITSSCHRCLGLPTGLVPMSFQSNSFLVGLAWSILWISPSHLILYTLMNLTISAPSISLSISIFSNNNIRFFSKKLCTESTVMKQGHYGLKKRLLSREAQYTVAVRLSIANSSIFIGILLQPSTVFRWLME